MSLENIKIHFGNKIKASQINRGMEEISVDAVDLPEVMSFLKTWSDGAYDLFLDACGVDYLKMNKTPRFEVVYHLYSMATKKRLRVRVALEENALSVKTVSDLWPAADWFEREAFDMLGIIFEGHPNLKRLLTWNEFEGHALRKDYPIDKRQPIPVSADIV